jgi:hypothetical protein
MLANSYDLTVGSDTITVKRLNQDNFSSKYFGEKSDGTIKVHASISHTIPATGKTGESHLIRVDVERFDSAGVYLRMESAWTVYKTFDAAQVTSTLGNTEGALASLLAVTDLKAAVMARES